MNTRTKLIAALVLTLGSGLAVAPPARADRAERQVVAWYQRYLDRYPDENGIRDWTEKLRRGRDPLDVEAEILASDEYWERAGSNPAGWVDRLFRDTTGRPPSRQEFRFWADRVRLGDRKQIAVDYLRQLHGDRPWN